MTDENPADDAEFRGRPRLEPVYNILQNLQEMVENSEAMLSERVEYQPNEGIYERAELEASDGAVFALSNVYYWSQRMDGDRLVDVPEEQLPDGVPIAECRLTVFGSDGTPLFGGDLADEGNATIGENRCLQVERE